MKSWLTLTTTHRSRESYWSKVRSSHLRFWDSLLHLWCKVTYCCILLWCIEADDLAMATQCISLKCPPPPMKCEPIITPIYQSVNYEVINCDMLVKQVMEGILYSRVCSPNSLEVEMVSWRNVDKIVSEATDTYCTMYMYYDVILLYVCKINDHVNCFDKIIIREQLYWYNTHAFFCVPHTVCVLSLSLSHWTGPFSSFFTSPIIASLILSDFYWGSWFHTI